MRKLVRRRRGEVITREGARERGCERRVRGYASAFTASHHSMREAARVTLGWRRDYCAQDLPAHLSSETWTSHEPILYSRSTGYRYLRYQMALHLGWDRRELGKERFFFGTDHFSFAFPSDRAKVPVEPLLQRLMRADGRGWGGAKARNRTREKHLFHTSIILDSCLATLLLRALTRRSQSQLPARAYRESIVF